MAYYVLLIESPEQQHVMVTGRISQQIHIGDESKLVVKNDIIHITQ